MQNGDLKQKTLGESFRFLWKRSPLWRFTLLTASTVVVLLSSFPLWQNSSHKPVESVSHVQTHQASTPSQPISTAAATHNVVPPADNTHHVTTAQANIPQQPPVTHIVPVHHTHHPAAQTKTVAQPQAQRKNMFDWIKLSDNQERSSCLAASNRVPVTGRTIFPGSTLSRLSQQGITCIFTPKTGRFFNFRVDMPFTGTIDGVHIGDTQAQVIQKLGEPNRQSHLLQHFRQMQQHFGQHIPQRIRNIPHFPKHYYYKLGPVYELHIRFNGANQVQTMWLYNRALWQEYADPSQLQNYQSNNRFHRQISQQFNRQYNR